LTYPENNTARTYSCQKGCVFVLDDNICKDDCNDGNMYIGINGICELKDCNDCTGNNKGDFCLWK
jgi:hypothetical protein